MSERVIEVPTSQIDSGWRARTDTAEVDALASSIKSDGQITPISISKIKGGKRPYELVAGYRRWTACKKLKQPVKSIVVTNKKAVSALRIQMIENVQRRNFSSIEMGDGLIRWRDMIASKAAEFPNVGKLSRFSLYAATELGISESTAALAMQLSAVLPMEEKIRINAIVDIKKRSQAERRVLADIRRKSREKRLHNKAQERQKQRGESENDEDSTSGSNLHRIERGDWQTWVPKWIDKSYKFDLCLTDPQYSLHWSPINHQERKSLGEAPSWDQLDVGWIFEIAKALSATATIMSFCPVEAVGTYQQVFDDMGWKYRGSLIWHKTDPAPMNRPGYSHAKEAIVWATRGTAHFTPWKNAGIPEAHDVITGPTCKGKERFDHPTQKPLWLMEKLLVRHASKGHLIIDPFAGVGSTLVACKRLGIAAQGCEVKQKYHKIAQSRLNVTEPR